MLENFVNAHFLKVIVHLQVKKMLYCSHSCYFKPVISIKDSCLKNVEGNEVIQVLNLMLEATMPVL